MQRRWYRSGVEVDSQVCMGRYIQKRLNSGQGEGRLKAAGGRAGQKYSRDNQAAMALGNRTTACTRGG